MLPSRLTRNRLVLAIALVFAAPAAASQSPSRTVVLGRVVEGLSDVPVADVLVTARGVVAPYEKMSALTDANGQFVLLNLAAGPYVLSSSKTGFVFGEFGQRRVAGRGRSLVLIDGQHETDLRVPIWKSAAASGTVVDETGDPLVGLTVQALSASPVGSRLLLWNVSPRTAQTDDRGVYRIFGLMPGEFVIAIPPTELAPGGPAYPQTFNPGGATAGMDAVLSLGSGEERRGVDFRLQMGRTHRVTGRVTGGAGVRGINVQLTRTAEQFLEDMVVAEAVTSADGSFAFERVVSGDYVLRVFELSTAGPGGGSNFVAAGETPAVVRPSRSGQDIWASTPIVVTDTNLDNVVVELRAPVQISGQVVFNGAAPVPRANEVRLMLSSPTVPNARRAMGNVRAMAEVDAAFRFRTMKLPAGRYFLRWSPGMPAGWAVESMTIDGRDALDEPIALTDRDVSGLVMTLTDRLSETTGLVRTARGAVDLDAAVIVFPADPARRVDYGRESPRLRYVRVNLEGRYVVRGLPAGDYLAAAVDDAVAERWQTQAFLDRVVRSAMKFTVTLGGKQSVDLQTIEVR